MVDFRPNEGPVDSIGVFLKSSEPHIWKLIQKDYQEDPERSAHLLLSLHISDWRADPVLCMAGKS